MAVAAAAAPELAATEAPAAIMATNALEASLSPPSVVSEWKEAVPDTLAPRHFDLPPAFSRRALRMPPRRILLAAAAIVALVGVTSIVASSIRSEPVAVVASPPAATIVKPTPAPAAPPTAVRPPATAEATAAPVTTGQPPGAVESTKSELFGTENTVLVTIRVSPPNAVVLKHGLRLGAGIVTIKVARGTKTTLSAQLYGYLPRIFVIDGENNSVDIALSSLPSDSVTSPTSKPDEGVRALSKGVSKKADTAAAETQSDSARAFNHELSRRSLVRAIERDKIGADRRRRPALSCRPCRLVAPMARIAILGVLDDGPTAPMSRHAFA